LSDFPNDAIIGADNVDHESNVDERGLTMKLPSLLLLVQLAAQTPSPPPAPAGSNLEKASIAGTVLRAISGEPLARAEVKLSRVP